MKKIIYILLGFIVLVSCEEFLDEPPKKQDAAEIETVEDLELLLNQGTGAYLEFFSDGGWVYVSSKHEHTIGAEMVCNDNYEVPLDFYNSAFTNWSDERVEQYVFAESTVSDQTWNDAYGNILLANLIIKYIDEDLVTGSDELKNNVKSEAHLLRAYGLFKAAVIYCLPFNDANLSEPGVVLRLGLDYEEGLSRATIDETWKQIETDIAEALKITVTDNSRPWRTSKSAVDAFAARFYLYVGNFTKALEHANAALDAYSTLTDYSTQISPYVDYWDGLEYSTLYLTYSSSPTIYSELHEQYQVKISNELSAGLVPSQELLNLYGPNDLRYQYFMVEDFFTRYGYAAPTPSVYVTLGRSEYVDGPSTAEMYLIRAELNARNGNIGEAMNDVETLRQNRFAPADYASLPVPGGVTEAVNLVLEERRREMPLIRMYDLKRVSSESDYSVTITRDFYEQSNGTVNFSAPITYTITPDSRLWARPIHNDVIRLSNGQTEQNEY